MARTNPIISSFAYGELSPLMLGRVQSDQYQQGCQAVTNMVVDSRGGLVGRDGTVFVSEVKDSTKQVRLVPFIISEVEAYVMEVGDQYIRYYDTDHAQVESSPSVAYETASPWLEAELRDIQFAQSNDQMWMVHDGYFPRTLTFTSATSWAIANATTTGAPWAALSDGHANGFPRSVAFFEQRLFLGGTLSQPNYLWGSKAADFTEFTIPATPAPDDAVEYAIAAYTRDTIQWLSPHNSLLIGTSGAEFRLLPSAYIATDNLPDVNPKSYYGSRHIQPARVGGMSLFVQASGRQLRSYEYAASANAEVYNSVDLSFLAEHITDGGIVELAYQRYPRSVVWAVRSDGTLLSMTFDPSLQGSGFEGVGWTKHDLDGEVESVCVVPNGTKDEVWVAVKRTIDGATARYIEYMKEGIYTDSSYEYSGASTSTISGLDHLEGETLDCVAGNAVHPQVTVSSGSVTLNDSYTVATLGLRFTPTFQTVDYEGGNPAGTGIGARKDWSPLKLRLHESGLPTVNGDRAPDRSPATPMDSMESLRTGDVEVTPPSQDGTGSVTVAMELPLPLNVLALHGTLNTRAA